MNGYITLDCRDGVHNACPICDCDHHEGTDARVAPSRLDEATWTPQARWVTSIITGLLGAATVALLHHAIFGGVL